MVKFVYILESIVMLKYGLVLFLSVSSLSAGNIPLESLCPNNEGCREGVCEVPKSPTGVTRSTPANKKICCLAAGAPATTNTNCCSGSRTADNKCN